MLACGRCDNCKRNKKYGNRKDRMCRKRECRENRTSQEPFKDGEEFHVLSECQIPESSSEEEEWIPSRLKAFTNFQSWLHPFERFISLWLT
jgi:hypothetical protein